MKHIRQFESYRNAKRREDIIKESVLQVNDIFRVKVFADIPQSLLNAYVKKVKDTTGKNLRQFFGDMDLAEEITRYIMTTYLDSDKIPANALVGGPQSQTQGQSAQMGTQDMAQTQPTQGQPVQGQPAQGQPAQGQPAQGQSAQGAQVQPAQGQPTQGASQDFEDVQKAQVKVQGGQQSDEEEDEEELPQ